MKIYTKCSPNIVSKLHNLGLETTTNIDSDFDYTLLISHAEQQIMLNYANMNSKSDVSYFIPDKWYLHNLLVDNGFDHIPTIFPQSIDEIIAFFNTHNPVYVKPRIGFSNNKKMPYHYTKYTDLDTLIADLSSDEVLNIQQSDHSEEFQIIIQKDVSTDDILTCGRATGFVTVNGECNFSVTKPHSVSNGRVSYYGPIEPVGKCTQYAAREFITRFISTIGWHGSFFHIEYVIENDKFYITDVSNVIQKYLLLFDDKPYFEDALKYMYGISDVNNSPITMYSIIADIEIPSGMTRELAGYLDQIGKRKSLSRLGDKGTMLYLRGETADECYEKLTQVIDYVNNI